MKPLYLFLGISMAFMSIADVQAEKLVIVATNDTHSQIDPDDNDKGGIFRRKVLVDSIRQANDNVLLVDAGDAVQGTLYFHIYKGEVEHKMMNFLDYDIAVLGNHDFDNGMESLARNLQADSALWLSTNYDVSQSAIKGMLKPYTIKQFGDKKVAFIGINLEPKGMISEGNYDGVVYLDPVKAANSTAWHLKHNEGVDYVVAVSHIGYQPKKLFGDVDLVKSSEDIDLIIGGHSHDMIDPQTPWKLNYKVANAVGDSIVVTQTGKAGRYVSEITMDLDNGAIDYRLIPVNSRLDAGIQPEWNALLAPYSAGVDELMHRWVGKSNHQLNNNEAPLLNFATDFVKEEGDRLNGGKPVDLALMNKGGLRRSLPKGKISEGMLIMLMPFQNRVVVLDIKGSDLKDAFDVMTAKRGGDGVSRGVSALMQDSECAEIIINGEPLDPNRTYRIATIDYLWGGGDYMEPLTKGELVAMSDGVLYDDLVRYFRETLKGKSVPYDTTQRMKRK